MTLHQVILVSLHVVLMMFCVFHDSQAQPTVSVFPVAQTVTPGIEFNVNIRVDNVVDLHLYHVIVHFDNTILRCTGVTPGTFFPSPHPLFFVFPQVLPSDTVHTVTVDEAMQGTGTRTGSGVLFSMRFTSLQTGVSNVSLIEVVLRDGANQNISHSIANGSVTVTNQVNTTVAVAGGWNLVSVPLRVNDYRKVILYPTSDSDAFRFESGYVATDTLESGAGYWLKFLSPQDVQMTGALVTTDTIDVRDGWNIIGSISVVALPADVLPIPPATIQSSFYGFRPQGGYIAADTLKPGTGYWVKVHPGGQVVIRPGLSARPLSKQTTSIPRKE